MALTIKDALLLPSIKNFKLISGKGGLNKNIVTAGIADYEFSSNFDKDLVSTFGTDSFVISSLLFATDDKSLILPAIQKLADFGVSCFAYKTVLMDTLPVEVIEYSNAHDFPIFSFGTDTYFENIIYEIMDAVQADDHQYLTDENINKMIASTLSKPELEKICSGISLKFGTYTSVYFIQSLQSQKPLDVSRINRTYYLSKTIKNKCILVKYAEGFFLIITSQYNFMEKHLIILSEILDVLSIDKNDVMISSSNVHIPFEELDTAFRESFHCHIASLITNRSFSSYDDIAEYKFLIPLCESKDVKAFSDSFLSTFADKKDFYETAIAYVDNGGDLVTTASEMNCHQNTIRYRISKIKELTDKTSVSDFEFYKTLSLAISIARIRQYYSITE